MLIEIELSQGGSKQQVMDLAERVAEISRGLLPGTHVTVRGAHWITPKTSVDLDRLTPGIIVLINRFDITIDTAEIILLECNNDVDAACLRIVGGRLGRNVMPTLNQEPTDKGDEDA